MPTNMYAKGMARGMFISRYLPVEVLANQLGVSPEYFASRYLISTRTARKDLGCDLNSIRILCGHGHLSYCVNSRGTIYLHPKPYHELLATIRDGMCSVESLVHQCLLESANRISRALLDDPIESEGLSDAY